MDKYILNQCNSLWYELQADCYIPCLALNETDISPNEEMLQATMTDEEKELFSRYTDAVREYQTKAECLMFQNSFKLGAWMIWKVMEE